MEIYVNGFLLDNNQLKPIIENPKYAIIIAGAGSGKTTTMVGKIIHALNYENINQSEILCISFTNESINNLQNIIYKNTNKLIECLTFHKLALKILDLANKEYEIIKDEYLKEIINDFFDSIFLLNKNTLNAVYKYFKIFGKNKYQKLRKKDLTKEKQIIYNYLKIATSKNITRNKFSLYIKNKNLLVIIYAIDAIYESKCYENNFIDFDNMIKKATKIIKETKITLPYKLIIIDEFQDTSQIRFELIKEIINKTSSSLWVIGDDYQSIYKFSGCDLNLFLNFTKYFSNAKTYTITKTYRNSQELVNIANNFISKNKYQIKKDLISDKHLKHPINIIYYFDLNYSLNNLLKNLPQDKEILLLGRNNFDFKKINISKYKNIKCLTIHKSKGLESDIVIIINLIDSLYGLPSKLKEPKIIKNINIKEKYPFEEERRLFYVALTRTKSKVYLLTPYKNSSKFIKELKKEKDICITYNPFHHPK